MSYHFLLQGNLPYPGIQPTSPTSPTLAGRLFTPETLGEPMYITLTFSVHHRTYTWSFKGRREKQTENPQYFQSTPQWVPLFWAVWAPLWRTLLPVPGALCFVSPLWPAYLESEDFVSVAPGNTNFFVIRMQRRHLQGKVNFLSAAKSW